MYETVCRFAVEKFGLDSAWIELKNGGESDSCVAASYGITEGQVIGLKPSMKDLLVDHNTPEVKRYQFSSAQVSGSAASFPIKLTGKEIGQLLLLSRQPDYFDLDQMILLDSYANLAAVATQNTWSLDQVKSGNERLHALSHRLMEVQESERLNLSRELHDESGQVLSAMMVQLGLLERDVEIPELVRKHAEELKQIAADVLSSLHEMAVRLRPASLDHLGLVTTLEQYIADFSRQHNLDVQFESVGFAGERYPIDVETALFRVVQESLTNVLLHAQATRVDVVLARRKKSLNVTVEDNGVGFIPENVAEHSHLGLFGMRERVEMLGGKLAIESGTGQGTTIQAEIPCGD
jgi:signal transduction histidine kinase